jgi:hypothetical protein
MVSKNLTEDGQRKKWYDQRRPTVEKKAFELVYECQSKAALFIQPYGEEDYMFCFKSDPDFPPDLASVGAFRFYYITTKRRQVSNLEMKTPDHYTPSPYLQSVRNASNQARAKTQNTSLRMHVEPSSSQIDPRLCGLSQPESRVAADTAFGLQHTLLPTKGTPPSTEGNYEPMEPALWPIDGSLGQTEPASGPTERPPWTIEGTSRTTKGATGMTQRTHRPQSLDLAPNIPQSNRRVAAPEVSPSLFVSPSTPVTPRRSSQRVARQGIGRRTGRKSRA